MTVVGGMPDTTQRCPLPPRVRVEGIGEPGGRRDITISSRCVRTAHHRHAAATPQRHRRADAAHRRGRRILDRARGRRRQSQPGVHCRRAQWLRRGEAGAALCAAGRRQLAAAAETLVLRISRADPAAGPRAGRGAGDLPFR